MEIKKTEITRYLGLCVRGGSHLDHHERDGQLCHAVLYPNYGDEPGTLWEHRDVRASCNHGFASYLCVLLDRHRDEIVPIEKQSDAELVAQR